LLQHSNDLADDSSDEQDENKEESDEQETEQQQDEKTAQAIADYQQKIAKLDERIAEHKEQSIVVKRAKAMKDAYFSDEQIERYVYMIEGETDEEMKWSAIDLSMKISPEDDYTGDPCLYAPEGQAKFSKTRRRPFQVDPEEQLERLGKGLYKRIQDKVFPELRRK